MQEMNRKGLENSPRVKKTVSGRRTAAPTTPVPQWKVLSELNGKLDEVIAMAAKSGGIVSSVVPPTPSARKLTKSAWELQNLPRLDCFPASFYNPNWIPYNSSPPNASLLSNFSPWSQPEYVFSPTSFKSDHHIKTRPTKSLQRLLTKTGIDTRDVTAKDASIMMDRKRHIPCSVIATAGTDEVESEQNVTMSQELLQLFSQIRILEERHNESLNLTTALHAELMQAHARVRELELPDRMSRREVDRLQKAFETERISWRMKEKEKIRVAVQSVKEELKEELEEERKEKNRLESANRRLAKELKEAQTVTAKALQELENERKTRQLMEEVCTELAQETGNKNEVEEMKRQSQQVLEALEEERRMLQLAEAWREERVRMKLGEAKLALETKSAALDVMRAKLESFLAKKRNGDGDTYDNTVFKDAQVLNDVVSTVRYDTSISTFSPTSSMSSISSNSFAPTSECVQVSDSSQESRDHGHSLLYYPEGIPDAD